MKEVRIQDVRSFWNANPLCASVIPHSVGSREYFEYYDRLREANESPEFSSALHEYDAFAGGKVLDVGCGNGYVLSRYARVGAEVFGVDITARAVDLCRRRFEIPCLAGDFREADARQLPFEDETFDCVCSMGVLHHVPDTAEAVAEIFRVLRPGGRLIVMFYHRNSAMYRLRFPIIRLLTGKSIQQLVDEVDGVGNPKGDVYSRRELRGLLERFERLEMFVAFMKGGHVLPKVGALIPATLLRVLEKNWGWFLYAKGFKPSP